MALLEWTKTLSVANTRMDAEQQAERRFQTGATAVLTMEVMAFLRDWLSNHIQQRDMLLGAWLKQHGHKAA